jgi:hypothetical protein
MTQDISRWNPHGEYQVTTTASTYTGGQLVEPMYSTVSGTISAPFGSPASVRRQWLVLLALRRLGDDLINFPVKQVQSIRTSFVGARVFERSAYLVDGAPNNTSR